LVAVTVIAASCALAACGSSSGGSGGASGSGTTAVASASGTTASSSGGGPNSAQRAKLEACLKKYGVTLPSGRFRPGSRPPGSGTGTSTTPRPPGGAGGLFRNNPQLAKAFKACGANFGGFRGAGIGRLSHTAINNYVTCVRQHGYPQMPAPNFSGKGAVFPANIRSNPKFQAASRACQNLLVPPRGGTTTGGSNT
jgi:hypothetical protein